MKKQIQNSTAKALEVGAGVAAGIAGALAAGYLLYKNAKPEHKRKMKAWVSKARADIAREAKKFKNLSAEEYQRMAAKAIHHYGAIQKASGPEVAKALKDAQAEWKHIQAEVTKASKTTAKKTVKKAVKKVAAKAAKKPARRKTS